MTDYRLSAAALSEYDALRLAAVEQVTQSFYAEFGAEYARFGERGKKFCREDIGFHLEFLRPVLDTGMIEPYSDYLRWFNELLSARGIPANHTGHTLTLMGNFFRASMTHDGAAVARALDDAFAAYQSRPELEVSGGSELAAWPELEEFENTLLRGDHRRASALFEDLRARGRNLVEIEVRLVEAALCNVGLRWPTTWVQTVMHSTRLMR